MKIDDQMMTVLTGLVVAVVLGTLIQESGTLARLFGGGEPVAARNDVLFVRSGGTQALDVTVNDTGITDDTVLRIVKRPACGEVVPDGTSLAFTSGDNCVGDLRLTYCIETDAGCPAARVSLKVHHGRLANRVPKDAPQNHTAQANETMQPPITALVATVGVPRAEDPNRRQDTRASDPYLQALVGLVDWRPGRQPLPDTPNALLMASAQAVPDPKATAEYLWSHLGTPKRSDRAEQATSLVPPQDFPDQTKITDLSVSLDVPDMAALPLPLPGPASTGAPSLRQLTSTGDAEPLVVAAIETAKQPIAAGLGCTPVAKVKSKFGARLEVSLSAPCLGGQEIVLSQGGVEIIETVGSTGQLSTTVPALALNGTLDLRHGKKLFAQIAFEAQGFDEIHRFAVVLPMSADASLIATERNRSTGMVREVTLRSFITHQDAVGLGRGYIRTYAGTSGRRVEIYTLPVSQRATLPDVTLKIRRRAEGVCGQPLSAGIAKEGAVSVQVVDMPACGEAQIAEVGSIALAGGR